jgi:hypothetical protein
MAASRTATDKGGSAIEAEPERGPAPACALRYTLRLFQASIRFRKALRSADSQQRHRRRQEGALELH